VHDGPRLREWRVEERRVSIRLGRREQHILPVPRLDPVVEPEPPTKCPRASESVALEALDPVRRPLLVDVTHASLAGDCCAEQHSGGERAELSNEAVANGRLEVLGDFEAQNEVGRPDLTIDRTAKIVLDRDDSGHRGRERTIVHQDSGDAELGERGGPPAFPASHVEDSACSDEILHDGGDDGRAAR
jgi:hypothetical protein